MFTERKLIWSVAVVATLAIYACITQPSFAKGGGHGGGHHGGHHASHHGGHNHHAYHPSHHHHAHHSSHHHSDHHHDHHHYAHHHHDWHHGSWGPGFWGGAAVGYGLGYGYGNWGGWAYDGDTYVDNSTNITPASDESSGNDSSNTSGDDQDAAPNGGSGSGSGSGFATDNWPELGIVTYAGQYGNSQGQVIVRVVPGSAAEKAGLVPGDVILTFNGKPVPSADDLDEAMDTANGKFDVSVWDARTGRTSTISGALDPAAPQPNETAAIPPAQQ